MDSLRVLYRDIDRTPYLFTMRHCAERRGLKLEMLRFGQARVSAGPTGHDWGDLLLAGDVDVIAENYWGLQSYRAAGQPVICVASTTNEWNEKLFVAEGIESLNDLRGKRFALRSPGPQSLLPRLWLADLGLGSSVEFVTYDDADVGRWRQWAKVADGQCQACFVTNIYADQAVRAGLRELPCQPYPFVGANVTLTTTEAIAGTYPGAVQALVDAAFDATELFTTDPDTVLGIMRSECAELLGEHFPGLDDAWLGRILPVLRDELAPLPVPTAEGVSVAWRIRLDTAPELREYNPMIMWDLSFARSAIAQRARAA